MSGVNTSTVVALTAQALLFLALICCVLGAKLPSTTVAEQNQLQQTGKTNGVLTEGHATSMGTGAASAPALARSSVPIVSSTDDLEIVAHTGLEGLGRQKRYIGWGRSPRLRYNKAVSTFDHDSLFNRMHNNFDKRAGGPEAPISSFRELRMKQKVPNIQLLLPHLPMRNTRIPDTDADDGAGMMMNDLERPAGGKLTQEDLEALAYLLEGDMP